MSAGSGDFPRGIEGLPAARDTEVIALADGDSFDLRIDPVVKTIGGATVRMLAYNGSVPGPTLRVPEGSAITINVENRGDLPATVHWHGLRLDSRYDGTHETQRPMEVGESFEYRLEFPDPGIYWYHPHIRQDYGQEMGLYGNLIVVPSDPDYWPPVHREVPLTVDDILITDGQVAGFSRDETTHAAMGRFGNQLLVRGESDLVLEARVDEVIRFYLTNTANTRVFNIGVAGGRMKLVGGDSGRCEREAFVDSVLLGPSERAVVDVLFERPGEAALEHRTPERTYRLASVAVVEGTADPIPTERFPALRTNSELIAERERIAAHRDAEPDKTVAFVAEMDFETPEGDVVFTCPMHPDVISDEQGACPKCGMKLMPVAATPVAATPSASHSDMHPHDHGEEGSGDGIEWEDDMVEVNRGTTSANTRWRIVDRSEDGEHDWRFRVGDRVKIRLVNETDSDHPMHHPFHIHGAGRFLVLSRDGVEDPNLVWTDTVLVKRDEVVDILLDVTHPGRWMAHCHIAEHHESGMMLSFDVEP